MQTTTHCGACEHRIELPRREFAVAVVTDFYCLHPSRNEMPRKDRWIGFLDVTPEWCPLKDES